MSGSLPSRCSVEAFSSFDKSPASEENGNGPSEKVEGGRPISAGASRLPASGRAGLGKDVPQDNNMDVDKVARTLRRCEAVTAPATFGSA